MRLILDRVGVLEQLQARNSGSFNPNPPQHSMGGSGAPSQPQPYSGALTLSFGATMMNETGTLQGTLCDFVRNTISRLTTLENENATFKAELKCVQADVAAQCGVMFANRLFVSELDIKPLALNEASKAKHGHVSLTPSVSFVMIPNMSLP